MRSPWRALALVPLFAAGCDAGTACLTEVSWAVEITAFDAATRAPLDATGSMRFLSGWTDQPGDISALIPQGAGVLVGYGRAGLYEVRATAPGYLPWAAIVEVRDAGPPCHGIETVHREAPMTAEAPPPPDAQALGRPALEMDMGQSSHGVRGRTFR